MTPSRKFIDRVRRWGQQDDHQGFLDRVRRHETRRERYQDDRRALGKETLDSLLSMLTDDFKYCATAQRYMGSWRQDSFKDRQGQGHVKHLSRPMIIRHATGEDPRAYVQAKWGRLVGWDVDDHGGRGDAIERASAIVSWLAERGATCAVQTSPGGVHVRTRLERVTDQATRRDFARGVVEQAGVSLAEVDCFPCGSAWRLPGGPGQDNLAMTDQGLALVPRDPADPTREWVSRLTHYEGALRAAQVPGFVVVAGCGRHIPPPCGESGNGSDGEADRRAGERRARTARWSQIAGQAQRTLEDLGNVCPQGSPTVAPATVLADRILVRGIAPARAVEQVTELAPEARDFLERRAGEIARKAARTRCQPRPVAIPGHEQRRDRADHSPETARLVASLEDLAELHGAPCVVAELSGDVLARVCGGARVEVSPGNRRRAYLEARDELVSMGLLERVSGWNPGKRGALYKYVRPGVACAAAMLAVFSMKARPPLARACSVNVVCGYGTEHEHDQERERERFRAPCRGRSRARVGLPGGRHVPQRRSLRRDQVVAGAPAAVLHGGLLPRAPGQDGPAAVRGADLPEGAHRPALPGPPPGEAAGATAGELLRGEGQAAPRRAVPGLRRGDQPALPPRRLLEAGPGDPAVRPVSPRLPRQRATPGAQAGRACRARQAAHVGAAPSPASAPPIARALRAHRPGPGRGHRVIVCAIDPGSKIAGYGVIDHEPGRRPRYVECGVVTAPAKWLTHERLREIATGLRSVVEEFSPDLGACEEVHMGKHGNVRAVIALARAQGVALECLAGVERVVMIQPSTWRKGVGLSSKSSKQDVARVICAVMGLTKAPPIDASDALAMALAATGQP